MSWITFFFALSCLYQHSESLAGIDISTCGLFERLQIGSGSARMNYEHQGGLPWMARVRYADSDNFFRLKCVGVIITAQWVLSGGRCVRGQPGRDRVTVFPGEVQRVGVWQGDITGPVSLAADNWFLSPATWSQNGQRLDVGLIHLATPIPMGSNRTHFLTNGICLPNVGDTPNIGLNYTLAGYYTPTTGSYDTLVRSGWGQIILSNNCPSRARQLLQIDGRSFANGGYSALVRDNIIPETVFCVNFLDPHPNNEDENRNPPWTCLYPYPYDVGSPLMIRQSNGRWMLVGANIGELMAIPSYSGCGFYGVYVNIYNILDWIAQTIQTHHPPPSPGTMTAASTTTTTTAPGSSPQSPSFVTEPSPQPPSNGSEPPGPGTDPSPEPPGPGPNPSPQPPSNETGTDVVPPDGGSTPSETGSSGNYLVYIALLAIILFLALVGVCLFAYFRGGSTKGAKSGSCVKAEGASKRTSPGKASPGKPSPGDPHSTSSNCSVRSGFDGKHHKAGQRFEGSSMSEVSTRSHQ